MFGQNQPMGVSRQIGPALRSAGVGGNRRDVRTGLSRR